MANALIGTAKLKRRGDKHIHPKTGEELDLGDGDFFALMVENPVFSPGEECETILFMVLTRTTLEQINQGIENALNRHQVSIKRV